MMIEFQKKTFNNFF